MRYAQTIPALLVVFIGVAACGDGVDERYDSQGNPIKTQSDRGARIAALLPPVLHEFHTSIEGTSATYSGASSLIKVGDKWLASGFDNHSNPTQSERGAVWRSKDLETWQRTGVDISDSDYQQIIVQLLEVDDVVLAFGVDYSHSSSYADVVVWRSTNQGEDFRRVRIDRHGGLTQAFERNGTLWAVGEVAENGAMLGQIWRSEDLGQTWSAVDPKATQSPNSKPVRIGPLNRIVVSNDTFVAIGSTEATDPRGDGEITEAEWFSDTASLPIDVGVWTSDDEGENWRATAPTGFAGEAGSQYPTDAVLIENLLVIIGGRSTTATSNRYLPTLWTCDLTLQQCASHSPADDAADFAAGVLATTNGLVVFAVRTMDYPDYVQGGQVGFFDPVSNQSITTPLGGKIEQIERIYVDDNSIYFLGRDPATNLMHVASTSIP